METNMQIEKLRKEYEGLLKELKKLEEKHSILDKEYKELNTKTFEIDDQIDDIEEEVMKIRDNIKDEEIKYVDIKKNKIVKIIMLATAIVTTLISLTMLNLVLPLKLIVAFLSTFSIAPIISLIVLNSKTQNKIKTQYRQIESYINNAELIEQKIKEISELKKEKPSQVYTYNLYKQVSNLEKQIEAKQKEMEDVKNVILEILFGDIKEENKKIEPCYDEVKDNVAPLVKTRRIDN